MLVTTIDDLEVILAAAVFAACDELGVELTREALLAAGKAAADQIVQMNQAATFANDVSADLDALPTTDDSGQPEFGKAAPTPFGFNPPV